MSFDIRGYLTAKFPRIEKYEDEWAVPCPVCDRDGGTKPHLYINVVKGVGVCYRCSDTTGFGKYGEVATLLQAFEDITYEQALRYIKSQTVENVATLRAKIIKLREEVPAVEQQEVMRPIPLPAGFRVAGDQRHPRQYEEFYKKRGLTPEIRKQYGIGYTNQGFYADRSIVPVVMDGRTWTWVARDVTGKAEKKVLYPKGSKTSRLLFNFDSARKRGIIVLVEGVYDAIRVGECGVAILGTNLSASQTLKLVEAEPHTVVVMLDPDATEKAYDLGWSLASYFPRVKVVPLERDPDEYTRLELEQRVNAAPMLTALSRLKARVHALR